MGDFFSGSRTGFIVGVVLVMWINVLGLHYVDVTVKQIEEATKVCAEANSKLVSLDSYQATCENKAVISYKVK